MTAKRIHAQNVRSARHGARRFGLLATACLGVVGVTAGAAQAIAGTGVVTTSANALANPGHPDVFQDSFEVHRLGTVLAAGVHNQAQAQSVQCSTAHPCRSVALSFQIVTMVGDQAHLNAVNLSNSQNVHCPGCESLAVAYQFVVSTDSAFAFSAATQQQLTQIHDELDALSSSNASTTQLKTTVDGLAGQVTSILDAAAAAAPKSAHTATQSTAPQVTVHRKVDQH
jgi:hypothetical protein